MYNQAPYNQKPYNRQSSVVATVASFVGTIYGKTKSAVITFTTGWVGNLAGEATSHKTFIKTVTTFVDKITTDYSKKAEVSRTSHIKTIAGDVTIKVFITAVSYVKKVVGSRQVSALTNIVSWTGSVSARVGARLFKWIRAAVTAVLDRSKDLKGRLKR